MDTSKEYQDMLKAAPEIQNQWSPNIGDYHTWNKGIMVIGPHQFESATHLEIRDKSIWGNKEKYGYLIVGYFNNWVIMDFNTTGIHNIESVIDFFQKIYTEYDKCIWLPRQDQLQEMVKDIDMVQFNNKLFSLQFEFDNFIMENRRTPQFSKFTSMEQMWLAYVMSEKYNKKWNGKEWI